MDPLIQNLLLGATGGLLPEILRLLAWSRDHSGQRGKVPLRDKAFWISLALGLGLGVFAVYLLDPTTKIEATAFGYAAPEFLTGAFSAVAGKRAADRAGEPPLRERLLNRWQP